MNSKYEGMNYVKALKDCSDPNTCIPVDNVPKLEEKSKEERNMKNNIELLDNILLPLSLIKGCVIGGDIEGLVSILNITDDYSIFTYRLVEVCKDLNINIKTSKIFNKIIEVQNKEGVLDDDRFNEFLLNLLGEGYIEPTNEIINRVFSYIDSFIIPEPRNKDKVGKLYLLNQSLPVRINMFLERYPIYEARFINSVHLAWDICRNNDIYRKFFCELFNDFANILIKDISMMPLLELYMNDFKIRDMVFTVNPKTEKFVEYIRIYHAHIIEENPALFRDLLTNDELVAFKDCLITDIRNHYKLFLAGVMDNHFFEKESFLSILRAAYIDNLNEEKLSEIYTANPNTKETIMSILSTSPFTPYIRWSSKFLLDNYDEIFCGIIKKNFNTEYICRIAEQCSDNDELLKKILLDGDLYKKITNDWMSRILSSRIEIEFPFKKLFYSRKEEIEDTEILESFREFNIDSLDNILSKDYLKILMDAYNQLKTFSDEVDSWISNEEDAYVLLKYSINIDYLEKFNGEYSEINEQNLYEFAEKYLE